MEQVWEPVPVRGKTPGRLANPAGSESCGVKSILKWAGSASVASDQFRPAIAVEIGAEQILQTFIGDRVDGERE